MGSGNPSRLLAELGAVSLPCTCLVHNLAHEAREQVGLSHLAKCRPQHRRVVAQHLREVPACKLNFNNCGIYFASVSVPPIDLRMVRLARGRSHGYKRTGYHWQSVKQAAVVHVPLDATLGGGVEQEPLEW